LGKEMMLIIVYDAQLEQAFFVDLRVYFSQNKEALINVNKFVRVYIPNKNILNPTSVKELRTIKNSIYGRS
jgi:IS30 family transposase